MLEAKGVGYRYGKEEWLFKGFSFDIAPGEIVGLSGLSGAGKTTLARLLAGYASPMEGEILLDGNILPQEGYHPIQLIHQHPEKAVNPRWKMAKTLYEGYEPEKEMLELFQIREEWLARWPNELSGGELQRFCVVRALGPAARFLIADEMTAMLDAVTQAQIWQGLLQIANSRQIGIVVITHDQALMTRLCNRVIELNK